MAETKIYKYCVLLNDIETNVCEILHTTTTYNDALAFLNTYFNTNYVFNNYLKAYHDMKIMTVVRYYLSRKMLVQ